MHASLLTITQPLHTYIHTYIHTGLYEALEECIASLLTITQTDPPLLSNICEALSNCLLYHHNLKTTGGDNDNQGGTSFTVAYPPVSLPDAPNLGGDDILGHAAAVCDVAIEKSPPMVRFHTCVCVCLYAFLHMYVCVHV